MPLALCPPKKGMAADPHKPPCSLEVVWATVLKIHVDDESATTRRIRMQLTAQTGAAYSTTRLIGSEKSGASGHAKIPPGLRNWTFSEDRSPQGQTAPRWLRRFFSFVTSARNNGWGWGSAARAIRAASAVRPDKIASRATSMATIASASRLKLFK